MDEAAQSILVADVGNTTTVVGIVRTPSLRIESTWRLNTRADRASDEWRALLLPLLGNDVEMDGAIISSVVPRVTESLKYAIRELSGVDAVIVNAESDLGMTVTVDLPLEVGADRLVNAVAARQLVGWPVIVVDAGTATKVDVVSPRGEFIGGAIAPGIGIGLDALASKAARLYAVELTMSARVIGRNTIEAVQSGLVYGHIAMVEGLVSRVQGELGQGAPIVVTGGYGHLIADATSLRVRFEPNLTLIGASVVWLRESGQSRVAAN